MIEIKKSGTSATESVIESATELVTESAIEVEVSLQDYFFASSVAEAEESEETEPQRTDRPPAPISLEQWQTWFQHWLEQLRTDLPPSHAYELSLRLTDDAEIQALNAQYRQQNRPTDVLAFAALEVDYPQPGELAADLPYLGDPLYLGDIVISVETAQRQSEQFGHTLQQELAWLAAHALLHLLGWDHPDQASLVCMLKQQEFLLQTVGLPIDYYQIEKSTEQEYLGTKPCKV